jgi:hypothetical protein
MTSKPIINLTGGTPFVWTVNMLNTLFLGEGGGGAVAEWLRHYATNRKVAGSIPDEVIFKFI